MSVARSLAWMGLAQGSCFALQFASSVVLAHFLGPYDMGIYAVAAAIVGALSIVQAFGLQALIVREKHLSADIEITVFTINLAVCLCLSAVIVTCSLCGDVLSADPAVRNVLLGMSIGPLFSIFDVLPLANLERRGQFKILSLIATTSSMAMAVSLIILAVHGFSFMSFVYAQWISLLVNTIMANVFGRRYVRFQFGCHEWRRVSDFAFQMLAVSGVVSLSARLSDLILARMLGLSALGVYNRASAINNMIWNNVHLVTGRVLFVNFAEINRQGVPLRASYRRTVALVTAILWPAFAGLALLSGPFILRVYGERWLPAAVPVALLAVASMIQVSITMTWELFAATGELRAQTRIETLRAAVSLVLFVVGCRFGLTGAAGARVIDAAVAVYIYRPHLDRMTQTRVADFVSIYASSGVLTVLAIMPSSILMASAGFTAAVPLPSVLLSIGLGMCLWTCGLIVLRHPLASECQTFIRRLPFRASRRTALASAGSRPRPADASCVADELGPTAAGSSIVSRHAP